MKFDYSQVPALQEDMNTEWQRYLQAVQAGIITINEFRDGVGLPVINGGDVLLRQLSVYEQPVSVKSLPAAHEEKQLEGKNLRLEDERKLTNKLTNFFEDELDRVLEEVSGEYGQKSVFTDDFWFAESEALEAVLRGLLKGISTAASKRALDELLGTGAPLSISWTQVNQAVNLLADQFVGDRIKLITDSTKRMVRDKVTAWNNSGKPLNDLAKDLEGEFGKVRAERIAVTEVTNAYGQANLITWRSSGVVDKKRWYGIGDELTCPICSTLIGQEVALDDYFVDGMGGI
jgi:SPP1 gp7 family putative phage head morphogenesis protein